MNKKKLYLLIIIFILGFSFVQYIYLPTYKIQKKVINKNIIQSSPEETLPTFEWKENWQTADYDYGLALDLDSSENIHVAGYTGYYPSYDILYLKYDKNGVLLDSLTMDINPDYDVSRDIILDSSDNVYISGYTDVDTNEYNEQYNTFVTKISSTGTPQWQHVWGGSNYDVARGVALDSSENVYIAGLTWSYGGGLSDALLIKYSNTGTFQWYKTYGGIDSEWVNSMIIDSDDNFYLAGGFELNGTVNNDFHLIKVDPDGVKLWDRTWGGTGDDIGISVALDSVGNVYILGYTESYGAVNRDVCIIKYNTHGDLIWNKTYGTQEYEDAWPLKIDKFDDLYFGGWLYNLSTYKDEVFLVKLDSNGNELWNMTYEVSEDSEYLYDLQLTESGDIYTTGYEYTSSYSSDLYLMKFNYDLPDIVLNKPENVTYTEPMDGYYLGTYGFERDPIGSVPYEWDPESNGGFCQVIQSLGSHHEIVELYDSNVLDKYIGITNNFSSTQTEGTLEFYFRSSDTNKQTNIFLYENSTNEGIYLTVKLNNLFYYKSMTYYGLGTIIEGNKWYHFRIEFNSTSDIFRIWVDGEKITYITGGDFPYQNGNNGMNHLSLTTHIYDVNYSSYFDAIGYSWDSSYNIGDNLVEGFLIDYKMPANMNWQAYSLDGQQNITTLGSKVIPFLDDGSHTIQIFGNTSNGVLIQSEKRFFTVDTKFPEIIINSPIEDSLFEGVPPFYNLTIIEENVISAWYTLPNLEGGITNITITDYCDYIDLKTWLALPDGPYTLEFYVKDILGQIAHETVTIWKEIPNQLIIELTNIECTEEEFIFTFNIHDEHDLGIDSAIVLIWWDEVEVSSDVQNLGGGLYLISVNPIFVSPGEEAILLQMDVFASGYDYTYFETLISIDPDTVQKSQNGLPVVLIIIISTVSAGALIGITMYIYLKKKKRK